MFQIFANEVGVSLGERQGSLSLPEPYPSGNSPQMTAKGSVYHQAGKNIDVLLFRVPLLCPVGGPHTKITHTHTHKERGTDKEGNLGLPPNSRRGTDSMHMIWSKPGTAVTPTKTMPRPSQVSNRLFSWRSGP